MRQTASVSREPEEASGTGAHSRASLVPAESLPLRLSRVTAHAGTSSTVLLHCI